ncbi:SRPBCC domain-containing protein [Streptomyces sp. NPDC014995]|uniref:SRPBCC domain-containing protein n=1 Tax=Streptomyces sp. NPDC014995 TaxID=3364936 RepID=UPI003702FDD0
MEHEVFVPVPVERLRAALADPTQVARAVPGLQQDAGSDPVAGRLKVRVGGHTITYRGTLRVTAREDGTYAVEGDATEARGSGAVKLALTVRLAESDGGTALRVEGTASADGRITELPAESVDGAVVRLLNRFGGNLGAGAAQEAPDEAAEAAPDEAVEDRAEDTAEDTAVRDTPETADESPTVFEAEIPASGLDDLDGADDLAAVGEADDVDDFPSSAEPPAEAAHARRTMIGRSAEEVDHAPPRGRYAPVPAPQTVVPHSVLRWAAPAAAFVVASAIVVGRVLRRRR